MTISAAGMAVLESLIELEDAGLIYQANTYHYISALDDEVNFPPIVTSKGRAMFEVDKERVKGATVGNEGKDT